MIIILKKLTLQLLLVKLYMNKSFIEKQILEWEQEIIKQNAYVLKLEGGVQAYRLLLQKLNEESKVAEEVKPEKK